MRHEALHPLAEVLDRVPGITRAKVHYYVQSQFVVPTKRRQGQVEHNWFTDGQIEFIGLIWRYEKGADLAPRKAYSRAKQDVARGVVQLPMDVPGRRTDEEAE